MPNLTPTQQIAHLDGALARRGTLVKLRKSNTAAGQIEVPARWRDYRPEEIAGIIQMGDTKLVISPTGLGAFGIPPNNGFVVMPGPRTARIIFANPVHDGGILVRIELQVRG